MNALNVEPSLEAAEAAVRQNTEAVKSDLELLRRKLGHSRKLARWPGAQLDVAKRWWADHLSEEDQWLVPRLGGALAVAFILQRWRARRRLRRS